MGRAQGGQRTGGEGRRQRDTTGSRFYRASKLTPDETFKAIETAFNDGLIRVRNAYMGAALRMNDERLTSFHRIIFGGLFAEFEGAGRYRRDDEPTQFRVPMLRGSRWVMRTVYGTAPSDVADELATLFGEWNSWRTGTASGSGSSLADACLCISKLYTGILRVHPFVDGNHRASFIAMSAALTSLNLPLVGFRTDAYLLAHDRTVGAAILPEQIDPMPFAKLLEERIRAA